MKLGEEQDSHFSNGIFAVTMPQSSLEINWNFYYFSEPVKESKYGGYEVCSLAMWEEYWTGSRALKKLVRSNRDNNQLHTLHSPSNTNREVGHTVV
jgi:hypothetical protein